MRSLRAADGRENMTTCMYFFLAYIHIHVHIRDRVHLTFDQRL